MQQVTAADAAHALSHGRIDQLLGRCEHEQPLVVSIFEVAADTCPDRVLLADFNLVYQIGVAEKWIRRLPCVDILDPSLQVLVQLDVPLPQQRVALALGRYLLGRLLIGLRLEQLIRNPTIDECALDDLVSPINAHMYDPSQALRKQRVSSLGILCSIQYQLRDSLRKESIP